MNYILRIIQEYFQQKIGRKIRISAWAGKTTFLLKKKECIQSVGRSVGRSVSQLVSWLAYD